MAKFRDRTGERYGRLTVLCEAAGRDKWNTVFWHCRCDCGNEVRISAASLSPKGTKSCGCLQREKAADQGRASKKDRTGERVGRLIILREAQRTKGQRPQWICRCDCGNEITAGGHSLYDGGTTSCGCLQRERAAASNADRAKHGHTRRDEFGGRAISPEYHSWKSMVERCRNPNAPNYHLYGGRGIKVCDRWLGSDGFVNFFADMGERPSGTTIDRIDNDKGYLLDNCRWATAKEQSNNRRETPEYREIRIASLNRGRERMWSNPEIRERLLESRRKK